MLNGELGKEWQDLWAWKHGVVPADVQDPHPWPVREISELSGWKGRNTPGDGNLPWTWSCK